ncbi:MAG: hypothetical protein ACXWDN_05945 [Limisphaerales bacterium]
MNRMDLCYESPSDFTLEMSVLYDDDSGNCISKWLTTVTWTQAVALPTDIYAVVQKIKSGPSYLEAMKRGLLDTLIPGSKNSFTYDWIPKDFFPRLRQLHANLDRASFKVINSLFWRVGVHCGPSKLISDYFLMEYSIDGNDFDSLPIRWDIKGEPYQPPPPKPLPPELEIAIDKIQDAPVHHALFNEAWKCKDTEDRVAIVMATAAVESAVKNLVSNLQPGTSWLLENTSSPPVPKMLREFFDELPVKCKFGPGPQRPPKDVITKVQKTIECRNKIVHGSPCDLPDGKQLQDWLIAIRDTLWLVDFYNGHQWAATHISPTVVSELKNQS